MKNDPGLSLEVYEPTGPFEIAELPAPRLATLSGKTVGELSNGGTWEQERTFPLIRELLQKRYPGIQIIPYTEFPEGASETTTDMLQKKGCQAVIIGNAARGEVAVVAGRLAARIEKTGIPTMVITRKGFAGVVHNSFAALGFPPEAPVISEFPISMFLPDSDLTPLRENIDKVIFGLTRWQPETRQKGIIVPPNITVAGKDCQEALDKMNLLFLKKCWGDGLPHKPATEERVKWIHTGTELLPDTINGKNMPRGRMATVKQIADSLAMAGGRPEYLPVLFAAVRAFVDPAFNHQSVQL
ncbi:MAG: hypothetical protein HYY29_02255, partial [Chloroflexi bacterium]|nr:hypothetical protein [Chloroflexota bacterium]